MLITRSLRSDFESDICSIRVRICEIHCLCKTLMYEAGGDPQVFRTTCIDMIEGMGPKNLNANSFIRTCALHNNIEAMFRQGIEECFYYVHFDLGLSLLRQAANEDHLEAIYLLGMIYISRGHHQCDEGLQLLNTYFRWTVPDDGEYTGAVDSAKELLRAVDDARLSVKGAFAIGHEEDEDRPRYCMVFRWYVEYGRFCIFLKNING
uniref:At2g35280-like TPR domain-containing protein n=1 Tax=Lactuca sativa TaxID=4236 RepID=A0A9R1WPE7_LACSA|nr:hypothetical protein LSAT_V11C100038410 [Lactuca sativa]